jgi:hypothetical protein
MEGRKKRHFFLFLFYILRSYESLRTVVDGTAFDVSLSRSDSESAAAVDGHRMWSSELWRLLLVLPVRACYDMWLVRDRWQV